MAGVNTISIVNNAGCTMKWRIDSNQGESPLSGDILEGQSNAIACASVPGIQPGAPMWPLLEPDGGVNHQCGDNVTYDPNGGTATYVISGGVDNLSCNLQ